MVDDVDAAASSREPNATGSFASAGSGQTAGGLDTDFSEIGRNSAEAMLGASKIAARLAESLTRETTEYARKSFADGFAILRTLADARTPTDLARIQIQLARAAFDNAAAFSKRVDETMQTITVQAQADPAAAGSPTSARGDDTQMT